ncbi:tetratricopeptide repeat protein [Flavobacteriaceae bacterium]|nr:tetratricopeptide repeat protein [Flavobacteriaceae bacterium]
MKNQFPENSDSPIPRFEQMLKTNEVYFFDAEDFECIIQYYIDSGEINLAKKALHLATKQHPVHSDLLLLKSELLIFDGADEQAKLLLDVIEELDPQNQEIFVQRATIYSKNKEHAKAIELLLESLQYADELTEIWCLLGMEYMVLEDYENAKENFKLCLAEDPQDYQVMYNLLYCLEYLKEYEEAISVLNSILEKNPYNEIAWHEIGKQYLNLDRNEEALSAFDFAIISEDRFTGAYIEKGKVLEKLGRHNEAIENYQISNQLDDPSSYAYLRIGHCHQTLGNDILALQYFKKSVQEDPSSEKSWIALIDFYIYSEDIEKALYFTKEALMINCSSVGYNKRNALLLQTLGHYTEAEIAYQNTIELGNYELEIWIEWMNTLIFLNEWEKLIKIGHQAKEFYPEASEIDFRIAGSYRRISRLNEADYFIQDLKKNKKEPADSLLKFFPEFKSIFNIS